VSFPKRQDVLPDPLEPPDACLSFWLAPLSELFEAGVASLSDNNNNHIDDDNNSNNNNINNIVFGFPV